MIKYFSANELRTYNGESIVSSTNDAGKIGWPHDKNETRLLSYTTDKSKFKIVKRFKHKS